MSMISSQCDERLDERLRRAAQTCRELGKHTTASMFLEAADTILELREMAQKANAENAKLRELCAAAWRCIHTGASCSDCRLIAGGCTLQTAMRELGVEI